MTIPAMKQVTIYTLSTCPYCHNAKALLDDLSIPYTEINFDTHPEERERIRDTYHWQTAPAIFFGEELIGGYDDLQKLHDNNMLTKKLVSQEV